MDFVVTLTDKISANAKKAGASLSQTAKEAKVLQSSLDALDKQLIKANALGDVGKRASILKQQTALKSSIGQLVPALEGEAAALDKPTISASKFEESVISLLDPMKLATVGIGLVSAAAIGLGSAFLEGAAFALSAASDLAQMTTQLGVLGAASGQTGEQIVGMLDQLSEKLPQTKDQLADWAKPLMAAGIQGDRLKTALQATAAAQAMLGDEGVSKFQALEEKIQAAADTGQKLKIPVKGLAQLAQAGADVNDIAKRMGLSTKQLGDELTKGTIDAAKFGDVLQQSMIDKGKPALDKMSLSLDSIGEKFKAHVTDLFENVDISPFTSQLKELSGLVDQDTESGKLLHTVITGIYDKFFLLASKALPYVKHGFQEVEIGALKIYIAAKPLVTQLVRLWNEFDTGNTSSSTLSMEWSLLIDLFEGMAITTGVVVKGFNDTIDAIKTLIGWADKATGSVGGLGGALGNVGGGAATGGMGGAISGVITSLTGHADGGVVTGVSGGVAQVSAAPGEGLTSIGQGERIMPASSGGSSGGGAVTINAVVNISGAGSSGEALEITEEQLSLVLERVALSQGLGQAA